MTDHVNEAVQQCRQLTAAMRSAGRPLTVEQLAAATGLGCSLVFRRLRSRSSMCPLQTYPPLFARTEADLWTLTSAGAEYGS